VLGRSEGPRSASASGARRDVAHTLALAGRNDEALAEITIVIDILEGLGADGQSRLRGALVDLAQIQLARAQPVAALAIAERALAMSKPDITTPDELAEARFTVARALWDAHGDRARARTLAQQAADNATMRGDVAQWLASR
jgi:hypothetical protein